MTSHERRITDPRLGAIEKRVGDLEQGLAANTEITRDIRKNTEDIVEFFEAGKGFFSVVRGVGTFAKWVSKVAAAAVIIWAVFRYGVVQIVDELRKGSGK